MTWTSTDLTSDRHDVLLFAEIEDVTGDLGNVLEISLSLRWVVAGESLKG